MQQMQRGFNVDAKRKAHRHDLPGSPVLMPALRKPNERDSPCCHGITASHVGQFNDLERSADTLIHLAWSTTNTTQK